MILETDPYAFARLLRDLSIDISNGTSELTASELSSIVNSASELLTKVADESNHYRMRSSIVLVVNGEEVELPDEVVEQFYKDAAQAWVVNAFHDFLSKEGSA